MLIERANGYTTCTVHPEEVAAFKRRWPCSDLPDDTAITFEYEPNGDLVGISPDSEDFDGPALVALSQDAYRTARMNHLRDRLTALEAEDANDYTHVEYPRYLALQRELASLMREVR